MSSVTFPSRIDADEELHNNMMAIMKQQHQRDEMFHNPDTGGSASSATAGMGGAAGASRTGGAPNPRPAAVVGPPAPCATGRWFRDL